ncbi:M20/M25/M40 family metallo-hydrolase [Neomicrococcus lactis]
MARRAAAQLPFSGGPGPGFGEVVDICRDLIRIDSSNYGDSSGPGERAAAEYVATKLSEVGIGSTLLEPEPRRTNLVARVPGRSGPALLVHGHLDVVPADPALWAVHPFAGEIIDGFLWGRGSIDMKHMVAMILTATREMRRRGVQPQRELVLAFLADEENAFTLGSRWLVNNHRELIDDCTEAISEVGGFSVQIRPDQRIYLLESGRKGVAWLRLTAHGTAGHASITSPRNSIGVLSAAVARIAEHQWPLRLTTVSGQMTRTLAELGAPSVLGDPEALQNTVLAPVAGMLTSSLRHVANPTVLKAGHSLNVVPDSAEAYVDGRFVPGYQEEFLDELSFIIGPDVSIDVIDLTEADQADPDASLVSRMQTALAAEDPGCKVLPYTSSASTDNASFAGIGIQGYGFAPLKLPPEYSFSSMFHGTDERVPVEALIFGARVLYRLLTGEDPHSSRAGS